MDRLNKRETQDFVISIILFAPLVVWCVVLLLDLFYSP
jgi:hypothetical protein